MASGTGSIQKLARNRWRLRVNTGKNPLTGEYDQRSKVFHGTQRDAKLALGAFALEVDEEVRLGRSSLDRKTTVTALIERYMERKTTGQDRWDARTLESYRYHLETHIRPDPIGSVKVSALTSADLEALYATMGQKGLSASTMQKTHALLSGALRQAVRWQMVGTNVARDASRPKGRQEPIHAPDTQVVEQFLAATREADPEFHAGLILQVMMGFRRGELAALRRSNIDDDGDAMTIKVTHALIEIKEGTWVPDDYVAVPTRSAHLTVERLEHHYRTATRVAAGATRTAIAAEEGVTEAAIRKWLSEPLVCHGLGRQRLWLKDTKAHQHRTLPLDEESATLVRSHLARADAIAVQFGLDLGEDPWLFSLDADHFGPWQPGYVSTRFAQLRKELGFTTRLHDLRHWNASELARVAPVWVVMERLGHRSVTTSERYVSVRQDDSRAAVEAVSRSLTR